MSLSRCEAYVRARLECAGPRQAFAELIRENDALIYSQDLSNGRKIAEARTAIHTELVRDWAAEQQERLGYDRPFAVVALGGTGRGEMAPCSDNDFAFLFEDPLEDNPFLLELQRQVLHSAEFKERCGFSCYAMPFALDDVPNLAGKQLNSFLDMRPVHDPRGLSATFRDRIRATFDPFEHFLQVQSVWKDHWDRAAREREHLKHFEIKHDGLRVFLAGIWILASKRFTPSIEIYSTLDDPRDLAAFDLLLRLRAFVHLRRGGRPGTGGAGHHPEDLLTFDDFLAFGDLMPPECDPQTRFEFANEVRASLLSARRRVALFAKGVLEHELKEGRPVSPGQPIACGVNGLYHTKSHLCQTPGEKSRAALSLLLVSQRYQVGIDPTEWQRTFLHAGDWLIRVPELSALFYEQRGSLAASFEFLSQLDGAEDRLFPGYACFESSLDARVMTQRELSRGAFERSKIRALENYIKEGRAVLSAGTSVRRQAELTQDVLVATEAALLDVDVLAAIKLALKTKRLPLTHDDLLVRNDLGRPLHERFSTGLSGIPLETYFQPFVRDCEFTPETLAMTQFLIAHRRVFKQRSEVGLNDSRQVEEIVRLCRQEQALRALFVFTCADRAEWESEAADPARWFNTRELYLKAMACFRPTQDTTQSLQAAGYAPDELKILRDFGEDFFGGIYRQYANRFGAHLLKLFKEPSTAQPRASILRDANSMIVGIAARDYRGLAASISGAFWRKNIALRQAHLFSAMNHGLALDFFHIAPREPSLPGDLTRFIEQTIQNRALISDADEAGLPRLRGAVTFQEWRPTQYCLRFETTEDVSGAVYALTYRIFRYLRGDIFGLAAHAARGKAFVSIYHTLPPDLSQKQAEALVVNSL